MASETHQDGSLSDKRFAPGYGEFLSTHGPDIEAMALASPTDSLPGGVPAELTAISEGATASSRRGWPRRHIGDGLRGSRAAWSSRGTRSAQATCRHGSWGRPASRYGSWSRIASRDRSKTRAVSIDASYASINLQLRYRPVTEVDTMRFELWTRRALVHAIDGSLGGVRSDLVTMEWIRDRFVHTVGPVTRTRTTRWSVIWERL